jgi:hypothetical protein
MAGQISVKHRTNTGSFGGYTHANYPKNYFAKFAKGEGTRTIKLTAFLTATIF